MSWWQTIDSYWHEITAWGAVLDSILVVVVIAWILNIKKDPMSAMAWCLLVLLLPFLGMVLFVLLGYQHVHRPLKRRAAQLRRFRGTHPTGPAAATPGSEAETMAEDGWNGLARLAQRFDAFPLIPGNRIDFYDDGVPAFAAIHEAIAAARDHIHVEYFIIKYDDTGRELLEALAKRARDGIEVRVVYDAMGSHHLRASNLKPLQDAGAKVCAFLPISLLRRRIQVNLRNHRKIVVVDGRVAFTGGLNVSDEYVGKSEYYGHWRDTHLRLKGPSVAGLQRVFVEDWDFASGEHLMGGRYFPQVEAAGDTPVQVIYSGPDQERNAIREIYFAAILRARKRLWIASPYFVPDAAVYDALLLAASMGVDVRLLIQFHPDQWIPYFAARFYFTDVLKAGMKIYQYTRGMMHSKVMMVDGEWASVGSANLDNRSMHLNFEANCLIYDPAKVAELEAAFRRDMEVSIRLDRDVFAERPYSGRFIENACRLFSPML